MLVILQLLLVVPLLSSVIFLLSGPLVSLQSLLARWFAVYVLLISCSNLVFASSVIFYYIACPLLTFFLYYPYLLSGYVSTMTVFRKNILGNVKTYKNIGSFRFCVISLTYNMIDRSLCPLCLRGSFHSCASQTVS